MAPRRDQFSLINLLTSPYRIFKFICFCTGFLVLAAGFGVSTYLLHFYRALPDVNHYNFEQLKKLAETHIQAKLEKKRPVSPWTGMDQINRDLVYAIVMSEDSNFFEHSGIDYDAILSSLSKNLRSKKYEYGASTISQQVVKNLFLTDEKSLMRKFREVLTTLRLERHFTKNQILELYLNMAEFGPDIFGVREASNHYFRKTPERINAAEGAFLAIMLPSPRKFHYAVFENENISHNKNKKIHRILASMLAEELISPKQYHEYLKYKYFQHRTPASAAHR